MFLILLIIPAMFVAIWEEVITEIYSELKRVWSGSVDEYSWRGKP